MPRRLTAESRAKALANLKPWKPGQSGNPDGMAIKTRAIRESVREKLDAAFTNKDGTDGLVQAIVEGVVERDSMCLKLAAEYRWGKAPVVVEDQDGNDVSRLPLSQLVVMVQNALVVLGKEDDET